MKHTNNELYKIWQTNSGRPGWLRNLWLTGNFTEDELDRLSDIDDEFLNIAKNAEKQWTEWKRSSLPRGEHEWLKVFPEARAVIPEKIKEWEAVAYDAKKLTGKALEVVQENSKPQDQWFWHEIITRMFEPVRQLATASKQIERLKRLLSNKAPGKNWLHSVDVARSLDIVSVIASYGVHLHKSGRLYKAHCPLPGHDDKTPSFFVDPSKQKFNCYGLCNTFGDAIKFVQLMENCSFKEAVHKLNNLA